MEDVDRALNEEHRQREEMMESNRRYMHRIETEAAMIQELTRLENTTYYTDMEISDIMRIPHWVFIRLRRLRDHEQIQGMSQEAENQWNEIVDNWRSRNIDNGQH